MLQDITLLHKSLCFHNIAFDIWHLGETLWKLVDVTLISYLGYISRNFLLEINNWITKCHCTKVLCLQGCRDEWGRTISVGAAWFQWDCMHKLSVCKMDKEREKSFRKKQGKQREGEELCADYVGPPAPGSAPDSWGSNEHLLVLVSTSSTGADALSTPRPASETAEILFFPSMERHLQHWLGCILLALQCRFLLSPTHSQ